VNGKNNEGKLIVRRGEKETNQSKVTDWKRRREEKVERLAT
jgi:hypothetical protein